MLKMSMGVAALLAAGLPGLACVNQAGLNPGGGTGGAGAVAGPGQTGGMAGGSGGTVGVGGIVAGNSGGVGSGGVAAGGTNGPGGAGGIGGCPPTACPALACVGGFQPNPDPCGCPICPPNPDAGLASPDVGLACCPIGFSLYDCKEPNGGAGFACHNPVLGCASSLTCGQGCDPQVSGRCAPDQDAGAKPPVDAACLDNVLCIVGDHFDSTLCKCVPDTSTTSCSKATDCTGALPALCEICANGSAGCAHFTCVAGQCQVAYCP